MIRWLASRMKAIADRRPPDFVIGGYDNPYLRRWWLIPRNRFVNVYLHHFIRSDDDRALHDHPWINCSLLLSGTYIEHTIEAGGIHRRTKRVAGDLKFRRARAAHRIEIDAPCWTLFITGPVIRSWGFHCPEAGWVHWRKFVDERDEGAIGRGCAQ
jgi:hypothetical protein